MTSSIRVGDRVIASTRDWGDIEGIVLSITQGRYVRIQSVRDRRIYSVLLDNCRRVSRRV